MSIFDNAKSILIGNKNVKTLYLDGVKIWSAEKQAYWNLLERTEVNNFGSGYSLLNGGILPYLSESLYINDCSLSGHYAFSGEATVSEVTSTGFKLHNGRGGYGIGLIWEIKNGQTITISMTKNGNCQIGVAYYDNNGNRKSNKTLGNVGQNLTLSDTSTIDGWVMIIFAPYNANSNLTFSNMSLSIN